MKKINLTSMPKAELFSLLADVMDELTKRHILRSGNNPVADYAEYLVSNAFHLKLNDSLTGPGKDAVDRNGRRYQIKARRLSAKSTAMHLSALKHLDQKKFDFLAGVRFRQNFTVDRAVLIPHSVVMKTARFNKNKNAWDLRLIDTVCCLPGVKDITERVAEVARANDVAK